MCKTGTPFYILGFNFLICIPAAAEIQWSKQTHSRAWQNTSVNSLGSCQIVQFLRKDQRSNHSHCTAFLSFHQLYSIHSHSHDTNVWCMEKVPDFERNGIKVLGKKYQLLYVLACGNRENLQHLGSFMMFIFVFLQQGYFYNGEHILCGIKHIVSF